MSQPAAPASLPPVTPPPTPSTSTQITATISEMTAIRLYNSVIAIDTIQSEANVFSVTQTRPLNAGKSIESVQSGNEFGNSCRICRYHRSDMEILRCPCLCKGSVGYIHLQCLRRWILQRSDNHCEICNTRFEIPEERVNMRRMLKTFCSWNCLGSIFKNVIYSATLIPLGHVVLQQVLICMDNINLSPNQQLTLREVAIASFSLLTSSALFFQYFEFIATRFMAVRNVLRQWWMFGNTVDFTIVEYETESFDFT